MRNCSCFKIVLSVTFATNNYLCSYFFDQTRIIAIRAIMMTKVIDGSMTVIKLKLESSVEGFAVLNTTHAPFTSVMLLAPSQEIAWIYKTISNVEICKIILFTHLIFFIQSNVCIC